MKILGFYISRTNWKWLYEYERATLQKVIKSHNDLSLKHSKPRDNQGRFISKKDLMTKQLRAEQVTDWTDLKEAIKKEEFGR